MMLRACPVFAIDAVSLPARETGVIASLKVKEGDQIDAAALIAEIDDAEVRLEETAARLQSQIAAEAARDETEERFADAVVQETQIALDSYRELQRRGSASDAEMRAKQLAVEQANLKLQLAKIARRRATVDATLADEKLQAVRQRLQRFRVAAPFAGTVTAIDKRPGEWVQAGQPVVNLMRLDELRVDAFVSIVGRHPSELVGRGVFAIITDSEGAEPIRLGGRVTHYDPETTSGGMVRIHATVQNFRRNGHWYLLPGMTVDLQVLP